MEMTEKSHEKWSLSNSRKKFVYIDFTVGFSQKTKKYHQIWTFFDHKSTLSLNNFDDCIIFIFCKFKKHQKTWISFSESLKTSKNFASLKSLKKHEFHFFKLKKPQKHMNFIFCKLKKPQKTWISFFASLTNLKKHEFHLLQA